MLPVHSPSKSNQDLDSPGSMLRTQCKYHPYFPYVLVCVKNGCNKAICIECEGCHSCVHQAQGTLEKYVSYSEYMRNQSKQIRTSLQRSKTIRTTLLDQLTQTKKGILDMVEQHFNQLQSRISNIEMDPEYIKQLSASYKKIQDNQDCQLGQYVEQCRPENIPVIVIDRQHLSQQLRRIVHVRDGTKQITAQMSEFSFDGNGGYVTPIKISALEPITLSNSISEPQLVCFGSCETASSQKISPVQYSSVQPVALGAFLSNDRYYLSDDRPQKTVSFCGKQSKRVATFTTSSSEAKPLMTPFTT